MKKAIELSVLCGVNISILIQDNSKNKVIHFASDPNYNILEYFNRHQKREFFANKDYEKLGGKTQNPLYKENEEEIDRESEDSNSKSFSEHSSYRNNDQGYQKTLKPYNKVTAQIGSLVDSQTPVDTSFTEKIILFPKEGLDSGNQQKLKISVTNQNRKT